MKLNLTTSQVDNLGNIMCHVLSRNFLCVTGIMHAKIFTNRSARRTCIFKLLPSNKKQLAEHLNIIYLVSSSLQLKLAGLDHKSNNQKCKTYERKTIFSKLKDAN